MKRVHQTYASVVIIIATAIASAISPHAEAQNPETKEKTTKTVQPTPATPSAEKSKTPWISLKDHWEACEFGGEGEVKIENGVITMEYGDPLTGVVWTGPFEGDPPKKKSSSSKEAERKAAAKPKAEPLPRDNYELQWECKRDSGYDFLCAMTFPIADQYASLVMGGWGGGITGISSIDGMDASDNDTTMFQSYDDKKWYSARVRIETEKVTVWINGKEMFDQPREGHDFDIRFEMDPCTPLGIANFECDSQIRKVQIRRLHPSEIVKSDKDD